MITSSKNHKEICKISAVVKKYEQHPRIIKIKENVNIAEKFSFDSITAREIEAEIKSIDINKASSSDDVPISVLTSCSDIVSPFLKDISDTPFSNCESPRSLKLADISPIHKKDETYKKENYRPVSLLPVISKVFERNIYKQMISFVEEHLSPYLCGFRKGYNTQICLIAMIERWQKHLTINI